MKNMLEGKKVLITGGTGSFGKKFVEIVLSKYKPKKLIIFSRDELKQSEMQQKFHDECIRYFIGDVRDKERLHRAFHGVDIVIHAAALKQVPAAEYNPFEVVKTNILGAENVINVAIDNGVKKVVALSTDKAVNPINLYGATKLCAEKLFVAGNAYSGGAKTIFSVVRYGNVVGSRGSVVPIFMQKRTHGVLPITDKRMTRFWITLEESVEFVLRCLTIMHGGEIFVPKIPSIGILDLAEAVAPGCKHVFTGIRPGEKINESLLTDSESLRTRECDSMYIIEPNLSWWGGKPLKRGKKVDPGFEYASHTNTQWLTIDKVRSMVKSIEIEK